MAIPALKVTGINHVVLHVAEMDGAVDFYVNVLGFEIRHQSSGPGPQRCFLRCGAQGLDLFETANEIHAGEEMNHMALEVEADNLDEVEAGLASIGVESSPRTGRNTVFVHDPDGHQIELLPRTAHERATEPKAVTAVV
jgi:catechol 2,3-dioxygenase-like lactoylglutathione lyase family enzyme